MNFKISDIVPIPTTTMTDIVEKHIINFLEKQALGYGDPLPKEQELADALGVSRNVVREALSRLRMLGMIETKKRRGMILAQPDILSSFKKVLNPHMLGAETLQDIFELRLVLEVGLADLIYLRKTDEDIIELEKIVEEEVNKVQTPFKVNNEIAFHGKLYQMTGNKTYLRFQSMLLPIFEYVLDYEIKTNGTIKVGKITHKDLVHLLKTAGPEEFRKGMKAHLQPHFDRLLVK